MHTKLSLMRTRRVCSTNMALQSVWQKKVKAVPQNSKDTPSDQWRCSYYHPLYCTTLGHKDCRSLQCGMKKKSKEERAAALKVILDEHIALEVKKNAVIQRKICFSEILMSRTSA